MEGTKNMASSSGCAINRSTLLLVLSAECTYVDLHTHKERERERERERENERGTGTGTGTDTDTIRRGPVS
jgi:hypothetical protein